MSTMMSQAATPGSVDTTSVSYRNTVPRSSAGEYRIEIALSRRSGEAAGRREHLEKKDASECRIDVFRIQPERHSTPINYAHCEEFSTSTWPAALPRERIAGTIHESRLHLHNAPVPRKKQTRIGSCAKKNACWLGQLHPAKQASVEVVPRQQPSARPRRRMTAGWLSRSKHPHSILCRDERVPNGPTRVVGGQQNLRSHYRQTIERDDA